MDSKTYWRLREQRWIEQNIKDDKKLVKTMNDRLQEAHDEIMRDIESFYTRYSNKEGISIADARKRVAQHDVKAFEKYAKKYVEDRDFSPRANEELRLYNLTMKVNRLELLKARINLQLVGATDDIDKILADESYQQAIAEFEHSAGIMADSTLIDIEDRARAVIDGSFHLSDSSVLNTFSDNIWLYKTELVNDLEKLLIRTITRGENPRVMSAELKKRFGVYGYEAERLARTEMSKVSSIIQDHNFAENKLEEYEFIAEPSACKVCAALDGKIFKVKDAVIGENAQPMHPHCVCSRAGYVDANKMYDNWLERGIISKKEYASLKDFRKDYNTKFEKLMEEHNKYEASMQKKRAERRPTDHLK